MDFGRTALLEREEVRGAAFVREYSAELDRWIASIAGDSAPPGVALVAVGGYGRNEMAPQSDIDIVLVHEDSVDPAEFAERIWYPIWDAGLKLGHRVDTVEGLLKSARVDLDTATSLLNIRHIAGDEDLSVRLAVAAAAQWREGGVENASLLAQRVASTHEQFGEVAFDLGPDLKNGRGGLRDLHSLEWARATGVLQDEVSGALAAARETLLAARVELHRLTGRAGDRLVLEYQDDVAEALDYDDADALMADVATAARAVAWESDAAWFWVERSIEPHRRETDRELVHDIIDIDASLLSIAPDAVLDDPALLLEVANVAATRQCFIAHESLERLAELAPIIPSPWTPGMKDRFTDLLRNGRAAIPVIEAIDQVGLMSALIPEWEPTRCKPQRNAYHRFTVDRHLLEAAAEASALMDRVDRPDILVLGALLHDIGKGYPGDHTDVGVELIDLIATNMGYSEADRSLLVDMCRFHLLLPDVATRRDLDDDGTIRMVADKVGSVELLKLLSALTEADSIATGPSAWNGSKAELVRVLTARVRDVLGGAAPADVVGDGFPSPAQRSMLDQDGVAVEITEAVVSVVQDDAAGAFSRVAGVLTLNGLEIIAASALTENGRALSQFVVHRADFDAGRLASQLERGVEGKLALDARVSERRRTYAQTLKRSSASPVEPGVTFDNETSGQASVIEVTCRDQIGVLFRISRALSEMRVEILTARIQTIGDAVVDSFYVTCGGEKLTDQNHIDEVERAVLHAIARK